MITNYEPIIILIIFILSYIIDISMSTSAKFRTMFMIQVASFIWFLCHFVHSIL
ncbi:SWPV1-226 [Shearwaterpox virus]|uniref:SWPV1-226 n=1 Tax=Shearwaterpox virus TaxID=1974596 RepID=A0A1V0QGV8_CNPV|nr:SWPV1-226 [Shearwaterpox virus]